MFTTLVLVIHIVVCVALILIILLQSGKGADIGAVFGGGSSQTVFGSTGATPFLSKVTIIAAVIFMVTSIILTYFSGKGVAVEKSIVSGSVGVETTAPTATPAPEPTKTEGSTPKQETVPAQPTAPAAPVALPEPAAVPAQPSGTQPAPASPAAESPPAQ